MYPCLFLRCGWGLDGAYERLKPPGEIFMLAKSSLKCWCLSLFTMRFVPRKAWRKPLLPLPTSPKTLQRKTLRWVCFFCKSIFLSLVTAGETTHGYQRISLDCGCTQHMPAVRQQQHSVSTAAATVQQLMLHQR